jgi:hypothetical protein
MVYLFKLRGRTLAARLLVLPTSRQFADYCGYGDFQDPLFSMFIVGHLQARAGTGRRLLAEMRLCRELAELESIAFLVFHFCDFAERNGHGLEAECAALAGYLGSCVYEDLVGWGTTVKITMREFKSVERIGPAGKPAFLFRLRKGIPADSPFAVRLIMDQEPNYTWGVPAQRRLALFLGNEAEYPLVNPRSGRSPWRGVVNLSRSSVGIDTIMQEVYALVAQLRRMNRMDSQVGAYIFGELVARVCLEMEQMGVPVLPHVEPPAIARVCDRWKLLPN